MADGATPNTSFRSRVRGSVTALFGIGGGSSERREAAVDGSDAEPAALGARRSSSGKTAVPAEALTAPVSKSGFLEKQSSSGGGLLSVRPAFQRRFFALRGAYLTYARPGNTAKVEGWFDLRGAELRAPEGADPRRSGGGGGGGGGGSGHRVVEWDLIVDDGLHSTVTMVNSLAALWPRVRRGGVYVAEDLHACLHGQRGRWCDHERGQPTMFELLGNISQGGGSAAPQPSAFANVERAFRWAK